VFEGLSEGKLEEKGGEEDPINKSPEEQRERSEERHRRFAIHFGSQPSQLSSSLPATDIIFEGRFLEQELLRIKPETTEQALVKQSWPIKTSGYFDQLLYQFPPPLLPTTHLIPSIFPSSPPDL